MKELVLGILPPSGECVVSAVFWRCSCSLYSVSRIACLTCTSVHAALASAGAEEAEAEAGVAATVCTATGMVGMSARGS